MTSASLAGRLGEFITSIGPDLLPEHTMEAVRRHALDTLGAAICGAFRPEPMTVLAAGQSVFGAFGSAPIWGRDRQASPGLAALVNGTAAHALELDDASGCDHSGAVVVPAVLAALDLAHCEATEVDLVAAIAAGYEVGRRVMEASGGYDGHNGAGWHSTGTCGVFGATAAVSRLLSCDAVSTANALGIAGSFASGTWAFLADGAMTKRLHPGHAASAALAAVQMSLEGFIGPSQVFEADWGGFLKTYGGAAIQPELLVADLGEEWRIHRSSIKPYPSCRGTHAAVEAILGLRSQFQPDQVDRISVQVTPTVATMCGGTHIQTLVDAQMSLPYALAIAVLEGEADLADFDALHRQDPRVRDLILRVELNPDTTLPSNVAARVMVCLRDGRRLASAVEVPLGSPGRSLPLDQLLRKYHSLTDSRLGPGRANALAERLLELGKPVPARDLVLLTQPGPGAESPALLQP